MASMPTTQPNTQSSAMPSLITNNNIPRMSDTICYSTPVLPEFSQDYVTHQAWPNPPSSHIDKLSNLFMCPHEGRLVSTLAAMQQCYVDPSFTDPSSKLAANGSLLAYMTAANNGTGNGHITNSISEAMVRMGNNAAGKLGHSSLMGSPCSLPMCDMEKLLSSNWLAGGPSLNPSDDLGLTVDPSKGGLALGHATSHPLAAFSSGSAFPERAAKFSPFGNQAYGEPTQGYTPNDHAGPMSRDSKVINNKANLTRAQSISGAQASNAIPDNASMQEGTSTRVEDSKLVAVDRQNQALCRGSTGSPSQVEAFQNSQKHCTSLNDSDESMGQEGSSSCERDGSGCGIEAAAQAGCADNLSGKKRRVGSKDRSKNGAQTANVGKDLESSEGKGKRLKGGDIVPEDESKPNVEQSNSVNSGESTPKSVKECSKPPEPPKPDYIHVRARRGQATDSHSLAERVRREKISERMKYLQDLVPGCSKVTGKAVMLDEIINYVQSLQRQVEFLSMKLAAVNPRLEFNIDSIFAREALPARAPPQPFLLTPDNPNSHPLLSHPHQQPPQPPSLQVGGLCPPAEVHPFTSDPALRRTLSTPVTSVEAFGDPVSQVWDDELQNVVQMGFPQGRQGSSPTLQGQLFHGQLKVEL